MTTQYHTEEAIADPELRYINFFNGRLLTAEDLTDEQSVHRARARHLGQALGAGVAAGLEVSPDAGSPPADGLVRVTKGLAVNPAGQTLRLEADQTVALLRSDDLSAASECVFADCEPLAAGTTTSPSGYYLLTLAPGSRREGRAAVSGLGTRLAQCNSRYLADGVQFRFLPLNVNPGSNAARARNTVAYECFGLPAKAPGDFLSEAIKPAATPGYGYRLPAIADRLSNEDVPLAVVQWLGTAGVGFIDAWAVRRRITRCSAAEPWSYFVGDRRLSEGEAMFLQFQNQLHELLASAVTPGTLRLSDHFAIVPPLGVLPVRSTETGEGVSPARWFGSLASQEMAMLDAAQLRSLAAESFQQEPVRVDAGGKLQLYLVWESVRAVEAGRASQFTLVFASAALPYRGTPRYGYAKWRLSRFAEAII